ncbi:MAG TPA: alpha/beta fold hydrolase [Anaeromyxobacteraceae bacterium]|nr:alpha/beta fold hydrolase [Anaeromyxobacteraceae bacterium]
MADRTTVRTAHPPAPRLLRAGVAALAAISPRLAAAALAPLFFRAPGRRRRLEAEREVLARGERLELGRGRDRLVAWRWGAGPPVLLAHGWGGCAGQMTPFVEPLLAAGFSVLAHDAPAHGESAGRGASIPLFADAIGRVAERAGPLFGAVAHSMGGAAFSLAAARGLPARRAVFVGPPADAAVWFDGFVRFLAFPGVAVPALRARAEAIAGERLDRLNSGVLGPQVKVPLLVVHDRQDREVPLEDGARVAREAVAGRLLVTDGLGHRRILRDPGVAAEVVRFLADGLGRAALPAA